MSLSPIIFSALPSSSDGYQTLSFHELSTSSQIHQLKPAGASAFSISSPISGLPPRKTTSFLASANSLGSTVVSLSGKDGRNGLLVWSALNEKPTPSHKLIPPGRVTVIALSPSGVYLAAGLADGILLLWELATGILLASFDAHYKSITCLAFSNDEAALVTASEDSLCCVWLVDECLDSSLSHVPYSTLSDHTLPISDIHVSPGTFPNIRIFTASLDKTVKVWSPVYAGSPLLSTFAVPGPAHHLAVDPLERFIFVSYGTTVIPLGSSSNESTSATKGKAVNQLGSLMSEYTTSAIRIIPLFSRPLHSADRGGISLAHAPTGFVHEVSRPDEGVTYATPQSTTITALHLPLTTITSSILLCGLSNGVIVHLSIPSLQPLGETIPAGINSSISTNPVTAIHSFFRPPDLLQNYSTMGSDAGFSSGQASANQSLMSSRPIGTLSRVIGSRGDTNSLGLIGQSHNPKLALKSRTTTLRLASKQSTCFHPEDDGDDPFSLPGFSMSGSLLKQPTFVLYQDQAGPSSEHTLIEELRKENSYLKEKVGEVCDFNDRLWKGVVAGTFKIRGRVPVLPTNYNH